MDFELAFDVCSSRYTDFGQRDNGIGQRGDLRIPPPSVSEAWTVPLNEILPLLCAHKEVTPQSIRILVSTLNLAKNFISIMLGVNE